MNRSKVALIKCGEYESEQVYQAVKKGLDLLGGPAGFVKAGEKIVLKPNVLIGSDPDKCVCTHPAVLQAVGRLLQEAGVEVFYGDSSGFGPVDFNLRRAGLKQIGDSCGFKTADFEHGREVSHKTALLNKKFVVANGILDADGVVSLPKLKTHGLMRMTGAVKNQFGCIPGILKGQFHVKLADPLNFARMLVDLNTLIRPRLYIMDAITAMEGNGPRSGRPRKLGVLLMSSDPIALDAVACKIINLNPEYVPTAAPGEQAGLGTYHYENIEVAGDEIESVIAEDFEVTRQPVASAAGGRIKTIIRNRVTPRPEIDLKKCTGCGTCIKMCPVGPQALDWMRYETGKKPRHKYNQCIRCYCCQETCPEGAITIKTPLIGRLVFRY